MRARRKARNMALQALYEIDSTDHDVDEVLSARLVEMPLSPVAEEFMRSLIKGVLDNHEVIDDVIREHASEWPLEQIAIVDRNVLRLAIYEFAIGRHTSMKLAINEAVELAKRYGSDSAARFVNGVLGTLSERQAELATALQHAPPSSDEVL